MNKTQYYDLEAEEVHIFGNLREISLTDAIIPQIPKRTKTLIDIGCGDGYTIYSALRGKKTIKAFGLDLSQKRLQKTKKFVDVAKLIQGSILALPFQDNSFDTVICSETLEHIQDYKQALKELIRISRKTIIITTPNEEHLSVQQCPKCNHRFNTNDHINTFDAIKLTGTITEQNPSVFIKRIIRFHTIFSYNRKTMQFPRMIRIIIDRIFVTLSKNIPFLKPNYLLIHIQKTPING